MIAPESNNQLLNVNSKISGLKLTPVHFQSGGQEVTLGEGHYRIGAGTDCDIRLDSVGIADLHCEIDFKQETATINPVDAKMWLNEGPVRRRKLRTKDRLTLGPVEFIVSFVREPISSSSIAADHHKVEESAVQHVSQPTRQVLTNEPQANRAVVDREDIVQERLEQIDQHAAELQVACDQAMTEPVSSPDQEAEQQTQIIAQRQREMEELEKSLRGQLKEIADSRDEIQAGVQSIHAQKEELKGLDQTLQTRLQEIESQQNEIKNKSEEITQLKSEIEQSRKQFDDEKQAIEQERVQLAELKAELEKERQEFADSRVAIEPPELDPQSIPVPDALRIDPIIEQETATEVELPVEESVIEETEENVSSESETSDSVCEVEAEPVETIEPTEPAEEQVVNESDPDPIEEPESVEPTDEFDAIGSSILNLLSGQTAREQDEENEQEQAQEQAEDERDTVTSELPDDDGVNAVDCDETTSTSVEAEPEEGQVTELRSQLADMFGIPAENSNQNQEPEAPVASFVEQAVDPVEDPVETEDAEPSPSSAGLFSERFLNNQEPESTPVEPSLPEQDAQEPIDTYRPTEVAEPVSEQATEPEPEEEENSVAAYMKQLLARSSNNQQPEPEVESPGRRRETYQRPSAIAEDNAHGAEPSNADETTETEPPRPKREKPDVDKDAVRRDMDSFRELANMSARTAVAKHSSKKIRIKVLLNLILAVSSFGLSMVLLVTSFVTDKAYFTYAILSALVGLMTGFELLRSSVLAKRSGNVKKPTQEALSEVQSELDSHEEFEAPGLNA